MESGLSETVGRPPGGVSELPDVKKCECGRRGRVKEKHRSVFFTQGLILVSEFTNLNAWHSQGFKLFKGH